ncbi:DUF4062 domain-containing protein [Paenibacillus etheri]|uniref:DUF4062 domain-containing protein n=1 Tax=Paenibacillus etheri TaxID=1306852 RepID=A0A0W1B3M8_9BACL|nr:DUF4062 domain-containing protein [Paenibacillus etheri]KTD88181.1 hypothetical protein UQ64_06735 [Paenibacillus etheri]
MKIFISSTSHDLSDFRALIVDRLEKRGHEVIYHESPTFPANTGLHSHDHCIKAINHADIVLCIIDRRYGGIYEGKFNFAIDPFKIKAGSAELEITVPSDRLSITWCELIEAYNQNKQVMTFARQRTLDEKHTRRKNQGIKDFEPAYVQANEVFDLLDWITKKKTNNWIASFENIVDFEKKLEVWITEVEKSLIFAVNDNEVTNNELIENPPISEVEIEDYEEAENVGNGEEDSNPTDKMMKRNEKGKYLKINGKRYYLKQDDLENYKSTKRITLIVEGNSDKAILNVIVRQLNLLSEINIVSIQGSFSQVKNINEFLETYIEPTNSVVVVLDKSEITRAVNSYNEVHEKIDGKVIFIEADPRIEEWLFVGLSEYSEENNEFKRSSTGWKIRLINRAIQGNYDLLANNYDLELAMSSSQSLEIFASLLMSLDRDNIINPFMQFKEVY